MYCLDFKFQEHIKLLLDDNFKTTTEFVLRNPCLYGDFRTALDESEPRLYEDIQDYDAAKALFQEVSCSCLLLYQNTKVNSKVRVLL